MEARRGVHKTRNLQWWEVAQKPFPKLVALALAPPGTNSTTQRAQYGLIKEYTLSHTGIPNMIPDLFLKLAILGSLGTRALFASCSYTLALQVTLRALDGFNDPWRMQTPCEPRQLELCCCTRFPASATASTPCHPAHA